MEGSEECSSSESGWTMYLASPVHEEDDDHGDIHGDGEVEDGGGEVDNRDRSSEDDNGIGNDDDDDSMASDASSGPAAPYIGHGKASKVVERKNHEVEAKKKEAMRKTKSPKKNQEDKGSQVR